MKRLLTITTATLALGAVAACGNSETAYNDEPDSERVAEQTTDTTNDTTLASNDAQAPQDGYGTTGAYGAEADNMGAGTQLSQQQRAELDTRLAEASEPTIEYNGQTYLTYAALNARDITGAEVTGADGERVATVDDVILDENGNVEQLVLSSGGLLGLGDDQVTVEFAEVTISMDPANENEPRIMTALSENAIDTMAEYHAEAQADGMLTASTLLGQEVELGAADNTASIYDLIMNDAGETEYAVLSTGLGSQRYLVDFSSLQPGSTEDTWMVSMTPERLQQGNEIVYF